MDKEWHGVKNKMLPLDYKMQGYIQRLEKLEELQGADAELEHVIEQKEVLRKTIKGMQVRMPLWAGDLASSTSLAWERCGALRRGVGA